MTERRQKYTAEFKRDAVKLVTEQGYAIAEAARNLGLNGNMLGRWHDGLDDFLVSCAAANISLHNRMISSSLGPAGKDPPMSN